MFFVINPREFYPVKLKFIMPHLTNLFSLINFGALGDFVLASIGPNTQSYPIPNDVNQALYYPASGIGGEITYFEAFVDQVNIDFHSF